MKSLYIIRHAKSSWSDPNLSDHDRPLNPRGERDKEVMAKFIKAHFGDIEMLFTSSATRALDYAACISKHTDVALEVDEDLYTFSSARLLDYIDRLAANLDVVALVTHNPAATEAINHLANWAADEKLVNLPTAAIAKLEFAVDHWRNLPANSGHVVDYAKPKALDSFEDDLD